MQAGSIGGEGHMRQGGLRKFWTRAWKNLDPHNPTVKKTRPDSLKYPKHVTITRRPISVKTSTLQKSAEIFKKSIFYFCDRGSGPIVSELTLNLENK